MTQSSDPQCRSPEQVRRRVCASARVTKVVAVFTVSYIIVMSMIVIARGNQTTHWVQVAIMIGLTGLVTYLHRSVCFTRIVLWGLSFWGLIHMAGAICDAPQGWRSDGETTGLYSVYLGQSSLLRYDHIVHFVGFGIMTWACWEMQTMSLEGFQIEHDRHLEKRLHFGHSNASTAIMAAFASMGFGALNEVVEFAATKMDKNVQVGGYENTASDLVANLLGAISAAIILYVHHRAAKS